VKQCAIYKAVAGLLLHAVLADLCCYAAAAWTLRWSIPIENIQRRLSGLTAPVPFLGTVMLASNWRIARACCCTSAIVPLSCGRAAYTVCGATSERSGHLTCGDGPRT